MTSAAGTPERVGNRSASVYDVAVKKLRLLVRLIDELRQATARCRRTGQGSLRAGNLSDSMTSLRHRINQLRPQIVTLVEASGPYPRLQEMRAQLDRFDSVLNEDINERGYEDGYTDRVSYLEKINDESGALKDHLEAMIAHIEYDQTDRESQTVDQGDLRTFRRLNCDEDDNYPVLGSPVVAQDSLYSGGDVAGM